MANEPESTAAAGAAPGDQSGRRRGKQRRDAMLRRKRGHALADAALREAALLEDLVHPRAALAGLDAVEREVRPALAARRPSQPAISATARTWRRNQAGGSRERRRAAVAQRTAQIVAVTKNASGRSGSAMRAIAKHPNDVATMAPESQAARGVDRSRRAAARWTRCSSPATGRPRRMRRRPAPRPSASPPRRAPPGSGKDFSERR